MGHGVCRLSSSQRPRSGSQPIGLIVNARFAGSFGRTEDASILLTGLGVCIDTLAISLPTVAMQLWRSRQWVASGTAWVIWVGAIAMTLLATSGWTATNIGDAVAGRVAAVDRADGLATRLHRLRSERQEMTEARSVPELDAALAAAQGSAGRAWARTNGCWRTDRDDMGACRRTVELREARARAERRDELDREIADLETRAVGAPAVGAGDPGAAMIAESLPWLTSGMVHPTERDVQPVRILGLRCFPHAQDCCSGWRCRRASDNARLAKG